uniref:Uncharacterized protein n=1 Tax=Panagrolaimus sp. JU765 TaxID=591449 RepID=A0AC34QHU0_9BILA
MLGAQALRTKQKAEQKEREKRQRERQRNLELQRERIQRAANEDAAAMQMQMQMPATTVEGAPIFHDPPSPKMAPKQRHSVHATAIGSHLTPLNNQMQHEKLEMRHRVPSNECNKSEDAMTSSSSSGSRFMKWLGLSSSTNGTRKQQRRMSTY